MAGYAAVGDLLTGNIPTPGYLAPDKFVQDAADEIDSQLGFVYETPFDVSETSELVRPARLLLKRLNVFLASGRLLMAAAASGEDDNLHAYAKSLVDQALQTLEMIRTGEIVLEGAVEINPSTSDQPKGPMWYNPDPESAVDAFYGVVNPPNAAGSRVNGSYDTLIDIRSSGG